MWLESFQKRILHTSSWKDDTPANLKSMAMPRQLAKQIFFLIYILMILLTIVYYAIVWPFKPVNGHALSCVARVLHKATIGTTPFILKNWNSMQLCFIWFHFCCLISRKYNEKYYAIQSPPTLSPLLPAREQLSEWIFQ